MPYLGEHLVFLGVTCRCADPPTSGGGASVEFGPGLEHSDETGLIDGDGEYELVGELTWPGGSAFGIGGLPLTVSV
ncbi:MAG: hypothetical protein GWN79_23530, partial [Actinobacteria bacterium]|nr:hypothetical protein [Actinomycetota bacterium]NIS35587.1 hypothetical protein [Actinomycetota bacterium]NIT98206.1 hypothetical protein [Actinomycetota bacterium]NIU21839.1 hypothetical protein [Actinomycetota bacterium]NIU70245.1 hypothetical protein [Actinomycetota bacterium]